MVAPGSQPIPLRESDHGALWERLGAVERGLAGLEGKTAVILAIDVGTFLAVIGLALTKAF